MKNRFLRFMKNLTFSYKNLYLEMLSSNLSKIFNEIGQPFIFKRYRKISNQTFARIFPREIRKSSHITRDRKFYSTNLKISGFKKIDEINVNAYEGD